MIAAQKEAPLIFVDQQGAMTYGTNIVEVNADIIIPVVTPGVPYYQTVPYQSNGWIGLSAWGKKGLIQTGEHHSHMVALLNFLV